MKARWAQLQVTTQVVEQQVITSLPQRRLRALQEPWAKNQRLHERYDDADPLGCRPPASPAALGDPTYSISAAACGTRSAGRLRYTRGRPRRARRHGGSRDADLSRDVLDARHADCLVAAAPLDVHGDPHEQRAAPTGYHLTFGTATASSQVEGATTADGRGPSIWDTFTARPGTISDGSDGSVACGSYERLDEDLDLLAGLGVGHYRFSVAWPRVQPAGSGAVEPRGLAYYDRLVDGLLGARDRADGHALPLGPAAAARGRGRLARRATPPSGSPTTRRSCTTTSATACSSGRPSTSRGARRTSAMPPASTHPAAASQPPPTAPRTTCCSGTAWPRADCTTPGATVSGSC